MAKGGGDPTCFSCHRYPCECDFSLSDISLDITPIPIGELKAAIAEVSGPMFEPALPNPPSFSEIDLTPITCLSCGGTGLANGGVTSPKNRA